MFLAIGKIYSGVYLEGGGGIFDIILKAITVDYQGQENRTEDFISGVQRCIVFTKRGRYFYF